MAIRRNRWVSTLLLAAATGLALPAAALAKSALQGDVPYEILVTQADVIAVVAVQEGAPQPAADAGDPVVNRRVRIMPLEAAPGGAGQDLKVKIEKILVNNVEADIAEKIITLTNTNMRRGPGGLGAIAKGERLVIALQRQEGKENTFFPLPYQRAISRNIDAATKEIEKYADIDKWSWGKTEGGLQLMVLPRSARSALGQGSTFVTVSFAIRNTTKAPIAINVFPGDNTLDLKAFWDDTPVAAKAAYTGAVLQFDETAHTYAMRPGQVVWLGPWGRSLDGASFTVQAAGGKCAVIGSYASRRTGTAPGGAKLWTGKLESGSADIEIPKLPQRGNW